ncbi:MAG TPA: helix-turn-helix domain-containing protein [Dermatophilaceae bacterium]|nr:helix-turn-helix domain-containing protein [Dermatophilaceae bacterium]
MSNRYVPDPDQDLVLDTSTMKALSHPLRVQIVGLLRRYGPATATTLAQRLGLNTGATSYHLRQLAAYGMIVEDETQGNARDRWWKAAHRRTYLDSGELGVEETGAYLATIAEVHAATLRRAVQEMPSLPDDWRDVGSMNDYMLLLTPQETSAMLEELYEVVGRYRTQDDAAEPPESARRVTLQLETFRTPGDET